MKKIEDAIRHYSVILKTTVDPGQQRRVGNKLRELKTYREKILSMFDIQEKEEGRQRSISNSLSKTEEESFLQRLIAVKGEKTDIDIEVYYLTLYMDFFYAEFLSIFSERKMKLDFKYSMDRDNFHQKFLTVKRRLDDYVQEADRIREGVYAKEVEIDMRRRNIKIKRNLFIEAYRYFKNIQSFTTDLLTDLKSDGLKCLNGDDIISFELIEEKRYLEGFIVKEGLDELDRFTEEVLDYLNIPEIEVQG
ncbi:MAG: hypothetical protein JW881_12770 [Spirochaetales bacterium]|nr:hypothetical protein [Spirochaetales bacterium]